MDMDDHEFELLDDVEVKNVYRKHHHHHHRRSEGGRRKSEPERRKSEQERRRSEQERRRSSNKRKSSAKHAYGHTTSRADQAPTTGYVLKELCCFVFCCCRSQTRQNERGKKLQTANGVPIMSVYSKPEVSKIDDISGSSTMQGSSEAKLNEVQSPSIKEDAELKPQRVKEAKKRRDTSSSEYSSEEIEKTTPASSRSASASEKVKSKTTSTQLKKPSASANDHGEQDSDSETVSISSRNTSKSKSNKSHKPAKRAVSINLSDSENMNKLKKPHAPAKRSASTDETKESAPVTSGFLTNIQQPSAPTNHSESKEPRSKHSETTSADPRKSRDSRAAPASRKPKKVPRKEDKGILKI